MELSSGFPFVIALKSYTAAETVKAILSVISILGTLQILSDQGSNFLSLTLSLLYKSLVLVRLKSRHITLSVMAIWRYFTPL